MRHLGKSARVLVVLGGLAACSEPRSAAPGAAAGPSGTGGSAGTGGAGGSGPDVVLSPADPEPRITAGTRLKPIFARTADGYRYYMFAIHDTQLDLRCSFAVAEDGKRRCLPTPPSYNGLTFYADAACTEWLLPYEPSCAVSHTVRNVQGRFAVHRLGPPTTAMTGYSRQVDAAGVTRCMPDTRPVGKMFFTTGAAVPPETFVEVDERKPVMVAGRKVHPMFRSTPDGLRERNGWWDAKHAQECLLSTAADGQLRCLPALSAVAPRTFFEDAACTKPLVPWNPPVDGPAPTPLFVSTPSTMVCPTRTTINRAEPRAAAPAAIYRKTATACELTTSPANYIYFDLGPVVAPTEFEEFTETLEGMGRLKQRVLRGRDGTVDRTSFPMDTQTGDLCEFLTAEDGKPRCVPRGATTVATFADATCQKSAALPAKVLSCTTATRAVVPGGAWCNPVAKVFRLGTATGMPHRWNGMNQCIAAPLAGYFDVGEPVPAADFVAIEPSTE